MIDTSVKKEQTKLGHIDQLRGIAILLVILVHVYQSQIHIKGMLALVLNFGIVGVQLFFLLSAYTLCMSMSARHENSSVRNFYIRRFFRIAPLYYLGIFIYFLVSNIPAVNLLGPLSHHENYTAMNVIYNVLFIHGMVSEANNTIVPGGWSIGTEMIFYLIFPAIFVMYERIKNIRLLISIPFFCLFIAHVFIALVHYFKGNEAFTNLFYYYNILNQLPVFAVGITYYFLERAGMVTFSKAKTVIGFFFFFLLSFIVMFKLKTNISMGIFLASISFCFLFKLFSDLKLSLPLLTRIGQLSFSIYIFHFLFAYPLVSKLVNVLSVGVNSYLIYILSVIITVGLAMIVASVSERLIEKPGINAGKMLIKRLKNRVVFFKPGQ